MMICHVSFTDQNLSILTPIKTFQFLFANYSYNIQQHKITQLNVELINLVPEISIPQMSMSIVRASTRITSPVSCTNIPTMDDILETSKARNLDLKLQKVGPFFRITAKNLETKRELGRAEGFTRVWFDGKILHLDSIRLSRETLSMQRSIFGVGLFLGAVAVRHGFDSGCTIAQLLAINDTDLYHSKLVRFYSRMGFKIVHEVDGSSIGDLVHMLVWGGQGTRMNADINDLLLKWCTVLKPRASSAENTKLDG